MDESILSGLVRIGTVTDTDSASRKVRVKFQDTGHTSDWLFVLQHNGATVCIESNGDITEDGSYVTYWMPRINETVVTLYLPVFNGDGFVLGGI